MTSLLHHHIVVPARRSEQGNPVSTDLDLLYYLNFLKRNWRLITASVIIAVLLGAALFLNTTPKYRARSDVVVVAITDLTMDGKKASDVSIDSAVQVLLSDQVLGETARSLDYPGHSSGLLADTDISPLINSRILRIYVSSPTPKMAYEAVTLLTRNFLAVRLKSLMDHEKVRSAALKAQLAQLDVSLAAARNGPANTATTRNNTVRLLTQQQATLQTELIALSISVAEPGYISHTAEFPTTASRPRGMIFAGSSLAVGLLLGCAVATIRNQSNPRHSATN